MIKPTAQIIAELSFLWASLGQTWCSAGKQSPICGMSEAKPTKAKYEIVAIAHKTYFMSPFSSAASLAQCPLFDPKRTLGFDGFESGAAIRPMKA